MKIEDLRREIDEIDAMVVKLIAKRVRIAQEMYKEKSEMGIQVIDKVREENVLGNVKNVALKENISQESIESIYREIIMACREVQG